MSVFVEFLRLFYKITTKFSNSLYVISHNFCQHISNVNDQLDDMCESENALLPSMVVVMKLKYEKY